MTKKGIIFNIQRFSIHDGPGIRTTVFLKGCPLECKWCCNPESIRISLEIMFNNRKCTKCGKCFDICPEAAIISLLEENRIDFNKCTHCMECVKVCSSKALERVGNYMTVNEIVKEVKKDDLFYQNSGGGVTISGGEPLLQWEFTRDILISCKEEGLHTALDTTGYAPWKKMREVLKFADLVLFDLKHTDDELHRNGTGVSNKLILENLKRTASILRTWLRFPVLPGYNDSLKDAEEVAGLALQLGVERVSLLVYHEWGKHKYEKLGRSYRFLPSATESNRFEKIRKIFEKKGVKATLNF